MSASDTWDRARGSKPARPGDVRHAVELDELREMDARGETRVHRINIGLQAITRELENPFGTTAKITHEVPCAVRISFADVVRNY
jgi:hypothetical protein